MRLTGHAYVAAGGQEAVADVLALLKDEGIEPLGNPDVYVRVHPSFSMEDARSLRDRASLRAVGGHGRIFVVAVPSIPPDAQNALLKTLEEPPAGAKFILIVSSPETLLPTLRSRMQFLEVTSGKREESSIDVKKFLNAAPEKRIEMLKPLLDKDDDDNRNVSGTLAFLAELERALARNPKNNEEGLRALYRARKYITDRGSLMKSLLEQAALLIPKML